MDQYIPNRIREILRLRKIGKLYPNTFDSVCVAANIHHNTLVNLANGIYMPKLDTAYKLARALNLTVYDIWDEHDIRSFLNDLNEQYTEDLIMAMRRVDDSEK
jgi:DNA-binding XRE family transcriptional regulator